MAGKKCNGVDSYSAVKVQNSKAFCEGMAYRASDTALNAPVTDNPHEAGSEAATCWAAGWDVAALSAGGNISKADLGCCAATPVVPV